MFIEHTEIMTLRITDINYGGHLGHMELLGILHEARALFLNKHEISEIEINGGALLMRQCFVDYLNQAFWNDELKIIMTIETEKAKIIFNYTVQNLSKNNLTAKAKATMLLINKNTKKLLKPNLFLEQINHKTYMSSLISKK